MPTYIVLTNGFADIDTAYDTFEGLDEDASTVETNRALVNHLGGELLDMYYTAGEYDAAVVVEFPDQETLLDARYKALELGIDDLTVLDAVHFEDAETLTAT